jgi:hypothetical protein
LYQESFPCRKAGRQRWSREMQDLKINRDFTIGAFSPFAVNVEGGKGNFPL